MYAQLYSDLVSHELKNKGEMGKARMCKEFRMLVEQTDQRYIAQCEHDTVHLCWGNLSLTFQPEAFLRLGQQIIFDHIRIARMFPNDDATSETDAKRKSVLQLRVGIVGVAFPTSDLPELFIALQIACALLELPTDTVHSTQRQKLPNAPLAIQSCLQQSTFSVTDHLN